MKKIILFLIPILFLSLTQCWLFKSEEECDMDLVSSSLEFEIGAGGKKRAVFIIVVRNNGTNDCSCQLTIDIYVEDK